MSFLIMVFLVLVCCLCVPVETDARLERREKSNKRASRQEKNEAFWLKELAQTSPRWFCAEIAKMAFFSRPARRSRAPAG
jgi:hypothetical protein